MGRVSTPIWLAQDGELLHRGGAVGVEAGHEDALALALLEAAGDLGGGRRLAAALQADHQDRGGRVVDLERAGIDIPGQEMDELVMDDLDDLLAGGDGLGDRLAGGLGLHRGHEVAGDGEGDVGLE